MFSFFKSNSIKVNELDNIIDEINLIDVREVSEYKDSSIKGSINIPMQKILSNPNNYIEKGKQYYILCQSGMRSSSVTAQLKKEGFNVINVSGGLSSYRGKFKK